MEGISEIIATIVGILVFGLPILIWGLFSALRKRRGRARAISARKEDTVVQRPTRVTDQDVNWLNRIKNSEVQEEEAKTLQAEHSEFDLFTGIDQMADPADTVGAASEQRMAGPLVARSDVDLRGDAEGPLPVSVDRPMAIRTASSGKRLDRLPPLKRAIVLSEILGRPVALKEEE